VDIANNLGISPISVSRALRNAGHVSEALRIKILQEADRLRYSPNNAARALRNNSSYLIGLIVPNFFSYQIDELVTEIQNYAQLNDHGLILGLTQWSGETEIKQLEFMVSKSVDGVIIKTSGSDEVITRLRKLVDDGIRVVCLLDNFDCGAYSVTVDNVSGGFMAGKYLIEKGHRKICYLTYEAAKSRHYSISHFSNERFEGLRQAMAESRLDIWAGDIIDIQNQRPKETI
jgi:DNA-binding LacI/PurR family transcriptional regulator